MSSTFWRCLDGVAREASTAGMAGGMAASHQTLRIRSLREVSHDQRIMRNERLQHLDVARNLFAVATLTSRHLDPVGDELVAAPLLLFEKVLLASHWRVLDKSWDPVSGMHSSTLKYVPRKKACSR